MPQLFVDVNRTKVKTLNVPLSSVFATLQAYLGSTYVNDFNKFGRTYQVRVQADNQFRMDADDIRRLDVRNRSGQMVPVGTFVDIQDATGPQVIQRFNLYPSAAINGEPAPGYSSGQALGMMEQMAADKLPASMGYEWTGMSYQEKQVSGEQYVIFALAVIFVFLVLAAQYESWTSPAAVIAVVPLAALGVVVALLLRGADNNTYTQIGVVLLVALASKNAILNCRVCRRTAPQGGHDSGGGRGRREVAFPSDLDDRLFVDPRFPTAADCCGRWRCEPAGRRQCRGRWDDCRDLLFADLRALVLCRLSGTQRVVGPEGIQASAHQRIACRREGRPVAKLEIANRLVNHFLEPKMFKQHEQQGCAQTKENQAVDRLEGAQQPPRTGDHDVAVAQRRVRDRREVDGVFEFRKLRPGKYPIREAPEHDVNTVFQRERTGRYRRQAMSVPMCGSLRMARGTRFFSAAIRATE